MSVARLGWMALINAFAVLAAFAVFNKISGAFETFVISGLVLIYTSISSRLMALGHGLDEVETRMANRHANVLSHFDSEQAAQMHESIERAREESTKVAWAMLLKGVFNVALTALAIFYAVLAWLGH